MAPEAPVGRTEEETTMAQGRSMLEVWTKGTLRERVPTKEKPRQHRVKQHYLPYGIQG